MPAFAQGGGVDVIAEFSAFLDARPESAADTLALLPRIRNHGTQHVPAEDFIGYQAYFCHQAEGWAVFYMADGPRRGEVNRVVLMAIDLGVADFDRSLREAILRHVDMVG
jgi:hypothetical protein